MFFRVWPLQFQFQALSEIVIPPDKSGNVFRGAFGNIFRKIACDPQCRAASFCEKAGDCAYAQVFEPKWNGGPSGLVDAPRAFVMRAGDIQGRFARGERFSLDLNLFSGRRDLLVYFALTFRQLAEEGVGVGRGRAELLNITDHHGRGLFEGGRLTGDAGQGLCFALADPPARVSEVMLEFRSPTEFKENGRIATKPEFGILIRRLTNRVANLAALYQSSTPTIDFRGLAMRADFVKPTGSDIRWHAVDRLSSRTGQRHPLGGFVGWAKYEGDLGEFLPWLKLARWVGVGRQTVWGKGEIRVQVPDAR